MCLGRTKDETKEVDGKDQMEKKKKKKRSDGKWSSVIKTSLDFVFWAVGIY